MEPRNPLPPPKRTAAANTSIAELQRLAGITVASMDAVRRSVEGPGRTDLLTRSAGGPERSDLLNEYDAEGEGRGELSAYKREFLGQMDKLDALVKNQLPSLYNAIGNIADEINGSVNDAMESPHRETEAWARKMDSIVEKVANVESDIRSAMNSLKDAAYQGRRMAE